MELIDKNALNFTDFEIVMCDGDFAKAFKLICEKLDGAPIIEAEPIKHGRWDTQVLDGIIGNRPRVIFCSCCGQVAFSRTRYCPNCGAKMEETE